MMNQRTCSHRISELYNEIILNNKFKAVYINQESYYLNNLYVTIFKDSGFKTKLLIIEKENQTIIFENLNDEGRRKQALQSRRVWLGLYPHSP